MNTVPSASAKALPTPLKSDSGATRVTRANLAKRMRIAAGRSKTTSCTLRAAANSLRACVATLPTKSFLPGELRANLRAEDGIGYFAP